MGQLDLVTVAIIFLAGLVAIGLTMWMLNRAWGNFPSRAGLPPTPLSPGPAPYDAAAPADEAWLDESVELPAGAPADGLVPVTHPMVVRAVQQAMDRPGSPYATYFIRDGERVYLALYRIADPAQREQARRLFAGLNSGDFGGSELSDLIRLVQQLGKAP